MDCRALAGVIAEVMLSRLGETRDRSDIDDGTRVAVLKFTSFLEEREESGGHEEDLRDIGAVCRYPVVESGVLVVEQVLGHFLSGLGFGGLGGAADAGVVD